MVKTAEAARSSALSEERIYDSSDDGESEPSSEREIPKPKSKAKSKSTSKSKSSQLKSPNGVGTSSRKTRLDQPSSSGTSPTTSSDNDTDEDEDETQEPSQVEDEDDSDKESASSSSSSSSRKRLSPRIPETPSNKRIKTTTRDRVSIPPKPFKAPKGYEPLTWSASDYASDMDLFDDLANKQIWHISVPSSVSIDSIKELDIEAVLRGKPILSRNGVDYGMNPLPAKDEVILLPRGSDGKYTQCTGKIERSFHMREVDTAKSKSQSKADTPLVFTATQTGAPKPIRKQPEGLRMRYVPYGVSPTQGDKEDVEMRDTLHIPPDVDNQTSSSPAQSRKARQKQTNEEPDNEKSPEKKLRGADAPASSEKKKKKKRRLVDEQVL